MSFIGIPDLLRCVNRTCTRLNEIIKYTSSLWTYFEFPTTLHLSETDLLYIFTHVHSFRTFDLSFLKYNDSIASFDLSLTTYIVKASKLTWLDLSHTEISTTCFLLELPNLQYLNLSQCKNLVNADFCVVANCLQLTNLYLAYNLIYPNTIIFITQNLKYLDTLDVSGVPLSIVEADGILIRCYHSLLSFHLSLHIDVNEDEFHEFIHFNYIDLIYYLHNRNYIIDNL